MPIEINSDSYKTILEPLCAILDSLSDIENSILVIYYALDEPLKTKYFMATHASEIVKHLEQTKTSEKSVISPDPNMAYCTDTLPHISDYVFAKTLNANVINPVRDVNEHQASAALNNAEQLYSKNPEFVHLCSTIDTTILLASIIGRINALIHDALSIDVILDKFAVSETESFRQEIEDGIKNNKAGDEIQQLYATLYLKQLKSSEFQSQQFRSKYKEYIYNFPEVNEAAIISFNDSSKKSVTDPSFIILMDKMLTGSKRKYSDEEILKLLYGPVSVFCNSICIAMSLIETTSSMLQNMQSDKPPEIKTNITRALTELEKYKTPIKKLLSLIGITSEGNPPAYIPPTTQLAITKFVKITDELNRMLTELAKEKNTPKKKVKSKIIIRSLTTTGRSHSCIMSKPLTPPLHKQRSDSCLVEPIIKILISLGEKKIDPRSPEQLGQLPIPERMQVLRELFKRQNSITSELISGILDGITGTRLKSPPSPLDSPTTLRQFPFFGSRATLAGPAPPLSPIVSSGASDDSRGTGSTASTGDTPEPELETPSETPSAAAASGGESDDEFEPDKYLAMWIGKLST